MGQPKLPSSCVSDALLADFNSGRLADDAVEQGIAAHVSTCERCAARLAQLPQDPLIALLRTADPLAQYPEASQFSRTWSAASTVPGLPAAGQDTSTDFGVRRSGNQTLPVRIDRYFIVRLLGSGGYSQVYLAKDPDRPQLVAIKAPDLKRLPRGEQRERFLREARTVATLDHPHIVPLYDCRELPDGQCIVVMQYIEGETLRDALRARRFRPDEAAEIVAQVAEALSYAHKRSICHRDVKPANVLLDRQGRPYLTDFGLALHEQQLDQAAAFEVAGTYPYMSPEQLDGVTEHIDSRTDIWSLGVLFYELLVGQRPFQGATTTELIEAIRHQPHPPLVSLDATIPQPLIEICERCLQKKAEERYSSAAEVATDLRAYLARDVQRRRGALITAAALVLVSLVALGVALGPSKVRHWLLGLAPGGASADGDAPDMAPPGPRALLSTTPGEASWQNIGPNKFVCDPEKERLETIHEFGRGFLSVGETASASFQVRFNLTLDGQTQSGGFYWAMHADPKPTPDRSHGCMTLVLRRRARPEPMLELSLEEMGFVPSPLDKTKLICNHSGQLAWKNIKAPDEGKIAVELDVTHGKLTNIRVNGQIVPLKWEARNDRWAKVNPAGIGFMTVGGTVVFDHATFEEGKPSSGEEEED